MHVFDYVGWFCGAGVASAQQGAISSPGWWNDELKLPVCHWVFGSGHSCYICAHRGECVCLALTMVAGLRPSLRVTATFPVSFSEWLGMLHCCNELGDVLHCGVFDDYAFGDAVLPPHGEEEGLSTNAHQSNSECFVSRRACLQIMLGWSVRNHHHSDDLLRCRKRRVPCRLLDF